VPGCDVTCDGAVVSRAGAGAGGEGVLCHACGYQYPNGHPSAKQRRAHRKHCGKPASAAAAAEGSGEHEASELLLGTVGSVPPWWCTGLVCGCVCPSWALVLTRALVAGVASQVRSEPARRNAAAVRLDLRTSTGTRRREGTAQVHVRYESPPPSLNLLILLFFVSFCSFLKPGNVVGKI
jgi:hypothetical protein